MTDAAIQLCAGRVAHARMRPFVHRFVYRVFCLRLRLDQPRALSAFNSWLFGVDRARPVSFMSIDHGARDGGDLMAWLRGTVQSAGLVMPDGAVWLQCFPRIFGYVFNPVSFWFCLDKDGKLRAVLADVSNTFGERHAYLLSHEDGRAMGADDLFTSKKIFHVSPFIEVTGHYQFRFAYDAARIGVWINHHDEQGQLLTTSVVGKRSALTSRSLLSAFFRYPLVTFKVIGLIHYQALRLFAKGVRYHVKPLRPLTEISR